MEKNKEIELLRSLGIIFVILAHINMFMPWNPEWIAVLYSHTYFWGGVDLFFAVSGYVITRSIFDQIAVKSNLTYWTSTISFLVRRFYRLIPASWFWLVVSIALSLFYNKSGVFGIPSANVIDAISQFFYLANWHFYYCNNGWGVCGKNPIYWSLSLEEQFYFILPVAIFFLRKRIGYLLALIIVVQFFFARPLFSALWLTRTDAIAWGCLIALLSKSHYYQLCRPGLMSNRIFRCLVLITLIVSLGVMARGEIFPFYIGGLALCCAIMVWVSSYGEGLLFGSLMNNRVLLWIASRSYSIYLCHVLSFYFVMETCLRFSGSLNGSDTFKILFFGLSLTLTLAELSYRFIELPIRKRGREISHKIKTT